ncbi:MAG: prepilin-type N-terminal cleavage/methylation domain-containing protein [Deltaproteobacteria bacterium]|nr:prepilin-type N-terminal cleavage/methylation domain-containing protein [Deltaproteobacteria bacterium]
MEIKLKRPRVSYKVSNQGFTLVELLIGMVKKRPLPCSRISGPPCITCKEKSEWRAAIP